MNKELIERLRIGQNAGSRVCEEAADALEAAERRIERLEAVYEAALLHVGQFTPYALHTLDLRNALAAVQTKQDEIMRWHDTMQAMLDVVRDTQNKINAQAEDEGLCLSHERHQRHTCSKNCGHYT